MSEVFVLCGDSVEILKTYPDNHFDSVVTDPPYGLSDHTPEDFTSCLQSWIAGEEFKTKKKGFMGNSWDSWVPGPELWKEVYRVLKPGGHLLAFAGSRTHDLMSVAIRLAGFSNRDTIMWVYGCLDEKTECLTRGGWKHYTQLTTADEVLQWDSATGALSWTNPQEVLIYPFDGEMVRFKNRHVDQMLTPNHRVYGKFRKHARLPQPDNYTVEEAGDIKGHWQTTLPLAGVLSGGSAVDVAFAYLCGWYLTDGWEHGDGKAVCFSQCKPDTLTKLQIALAPYKHSEYVRTAKKDTHSTEHAFYLPGDIATKLMEAFPGKVLTPSVLSWSKEARLALLEGLMDGDGSHKHGQYSKVFWSMNGERRGIVAALAASLGYRAYEDATKGCVHFNTSTASSQVQSKHRQAREHYKGDVWCLRVHTGAFMVRRNTKIFITGNSGFPKSMDVSKAIDKAAGVTGSYGEKKPNAHSRGNHVQHDGWKRPWQDDPEVVDKSGREYLPQSAAARQWQGWGTALKPAYEPILMFRKPFTGTVAQNVLECGTGAINIDGCRVRSEESAVTRFPANFTHDGSEEVLGLFPDSNGAGKSLPRVKVTGYGNKNTGTGTAEYFGGDRIPFDSGSGSAARFFYSPKASKKDRGEGNTHPTVKPRELMKWLVRMVTPNGGKVLDPFGGSGTTGVACIEEGFDCVLIELDQKHVDIINNRLIECKLSLRNKLEFEE